MILRRDRLSLSLPKAFGSKPLIFTVWRSGGGVGIEGKELLCCVSMRSSGRSPPFLTKGSSKMGARLAWVGPGESPIPQATFPLLNAISDSSSGPSTTGFSP